MNITTGNSRKVEDPKALPDEPSIRVVLLPRDTNSQGTIFGGIILSYIDLAGAVEVGKTTRQKVVTVGIKEVSFKAPVFVGEVVSFYTTTTRVGKTSVTVHVDVEVWRQQESIHVTEAELTFVCVDENGNPTSVVQSSKRINRSKSKSR